MGDLMSSTPDPGDPPIRAAIVGLGLAGRLAAREVVKSPFLQLVAVCDLNVPIASQVAASSGARAYVDYEEMYSDPSIEAILVATPTHMRLPHIESALKHGKHVMSEKPLARSSNEARSIVERVADSGLTLTSINTRGRDPIVQAMARLLRFSDFGAVLSLTNIMYKPWVLSPRFDYEMNPDLGGGVNFRQAPHQVEIARTIIDDEVSSVSATVGHVDTPVDSYGNFNALLRFRSGATASLVFNGYGYFDTSELTWGIGEGGRERQPGQGIALRHSESWKQVKYAAPPPGDTQNLDAGSRNLSIYGLTIVSCQLADLRPGRTGILVYDYDSIHEVAVRPSDGGIQQDFAEFYAAVRDGRPCLHDAAWGARTVDICEAIWRSAQDDDIVRL